MKKAIDKINKMDEDKLKENILYLALGIFSLIYTTQKFIHLGMTITFVILLVMLGIEIGTFFLLKRWKKNNIPLHKIYLVVAIILGITYIFAFPPSQLPDEVNDYGRSLEVSQGKLVTQMRGQTAGNYSSKNVLKVYKSDKYSEVIKNADLKLDGEQTFLLFANKALYNFFCYIPQAIGIGIASLLNLPILIQIYFGKICNYALFVFLIYLSIKYIPTKKFLVFFTALLPITIQEAASLSPDSMTIATSIALISFILWSRKNKQKFETKHYISLAIMTIALSLCKIVYLPLCFLMFLIPKECFKNIKHKKVFCCVLSAVVILLNLAWLKYSSRYLEAFFSISNSGEQLKYILSNPFRYVLILSTTMDVYLAAYLEQMLGHSLGKFVVTTSYVMVFIALFILVNLIKETNKEEKKEFSILEKGWIFLLVIGTILLTFTSLYMQWTAVGSAVVEGIQGRYFIPLFLPIATLFMTKTKKEEKPKDLLLTFTLVQNFMAIASIITTFI